MAAGASYQNFIRHFISMHLHSGSRNPVRVQWLLCTVLVSPSRDLECLKDVAYDNEDTVFGNESSGTDTVVAHE